MIYARRFPPPWSVEELDACFVVKGRDGQKLAYVYFEDEPSVLLAPGCLDLSVQCDLLPCSTSRPSPDADEILTIFWTARKFRG